MAEVVESWQENFADFQSIDDPFRGEEEFAGMECGTGCGANGECGHGCGAGCHVDNQAKGDAGCHTECSDAADTSATAEAAELSGDHVDAGSLAEMDNLRQQLDEERRKLLTTLADMANLRKRTEKEIFNARKYALEGFAKDMLETVDNLERSLENPDQRPEELKEFYAGIELTLKSLKEALGRYGVTEINPINQPFDHQLHTAISMQPIPPGSEMVAGTVINVIQKGYLLKDRLLRPAMVAVAQ